jgi:hypothetical protein
MLVTVEEMENKWKKNYGNLWLIMPHLSHKLNNYYLILTYQKIQELLIFDSQTIF